ncbi:hypothetical protein HMPREF0290_2445 [Corynebacterium efficiens YS-314]|uniref:Uncharacterized protein n=1 Tax=Corynebacterium efficiens (strain DSM 44549 / YS-314 / AJ 12310 / JCM 11189 / NBRC 100395) TaxID=196164 RepID=Q8FMU5_COREF|nr:hypothetical protein [Corynebacterium efficiens]EEW48920.1 hypothetical protein HMPREF0290_2445 [Corynebacterium efficiens YS-314]BAC19214.1 hypothetical protein [Corynebacterium efficiens YS-314]
MSDTRPGPDTDEFPAIQEGMDAPVAVHGPGITVAPVRRDTRATGITIGLLVVLLLVVVGAVAYVVTGLGSDDPVPQTVVVTETPIVEAEPEQAPEPAPEPTPEPAEPTDIPAGRPTAPALPAGHSPVNDAATQNLPGGDLNNVYTGTSSTSPGFALNVRDAFVRYYLDTGQLNGQVRATSPATGMTYDVDCVDNGEFVTCTAGENAVIYIS